MTADQKRKELFYAAEDLRKHEREIHKLQEKIDVLKEQLQDRRKAVEKAKDRMLTVAQTTPLGIPD